MASHFPRLTSRGCVEASQGPGGVPDEYSHLSTTHESWLR